MGAKEAFIQALYSDFFLLWDTLATTSHKLELTTLFSLT